MKELEVARLSLKMESQPDGGRWVTPPSRIFQGCLKAEAEGSERGKSYTQFLG